MKATIEFPDWINENEFEFVGWKYLESGEYGIGSLEAKEWNIQGWRPLVHGGLVSYQWTNKFFCFRKKQKFVWPEHLEDGVKLICTSWSGSWMLEQPSDTSSIWVNFYNSFHKPEYQIDTSMLDKDKVYVKGGINNEYI